MFFLAILWNGCSSSLPDAKKIQSNSEDIYVDSLRINTKEIYAWVNRMPGQKPRFHVTGNLQIFEDTKYNLNNLIIEGVKVKQGANIIYQFTPTYEAKYLESFKSIVFSTVRGLLLLSTLDVNKDISITIKLSDSLNEIEYSINKIKIEEVH